MSRVPHRYTGGISELRPKVPPGGLASGRQPHEPLAKPYVDVGEVRASEHRSHQGSTPVLRAEIPQGLYPNAASAVLAAGAPAIAGSPLCLTASIAATSSIHPQNLVGSPAPMATEPVIGSDPTSTASFRCVARSVMDVLWPLPTSFAPGNHPRIRRLGVNFMAVGEVKDRRGRRNRGRSGLLEREGALSAIADVIDAAREGAGLALLITGHPGMGKTRLYEAALDSARSRKLRVIRAAGAELEQSVALGVAVQIARSALAGLAGSQRKAIDRKSVV